MIQKFMRKGDFEVEAMAKLWYYDKTTSGKEEEEENE